MSRRIAKYMSGSLRINCGVGNIRLLENGGKLLEKTNTLIGRTNHASGVRHRVGRDIVSNTGTNAEARPCLSSTVGEWVAWRSNAGSCPRVLSLSTIWICGGGGAGARVGAQPVAGAWDGAVGCRFSLKVAYEELS